MKKFIYYVTFLLYQMKKITDYIKPYGIIYIIKNKVNNKCYIGQTAKKLDKRCKWEKKSIFNNYSKNLHLISSIKKYDLENFERRILDFAQNQEELDDKEEYYIQKFNTLNQDFGYNLKHGGEHGKFTPLIKEKISKALKKYYKNSEHHTKDKTYDDIMGKKRANIRKNKMSEKRKNKTYDDLVGKKKAKIWRNNNKKSKIEYFKDPKNRKKTSRLTKEAMKNPKIREKISKGVKKAYENSDLNKKLSNSMKKKYQNNPSLREKISKRMKKQWKDQDYRDKQSEKHKELWIDTKYRDKQTNTRNSIEYRKKLSLLKKDMWKNPNTRKKIIENNTDYHFTRKYLIKEYWLDEYHMQNRILDLRQKSMNQIAKENDCSTQPISDNMKKYNVSIRNSSEAMTINNSKKEWKENQSKKLLSPKYFCSRCNKNHHELSNIGKKHINFKN